MELEDIWEKIANNARLTREELSFLKQSARETQLRNSFVAGNTTAQNTLSLNLPINIIYSEVLQKNTPSVDIRISPDYKHLVLLSSVITDGNVGGDFIHGRFNNDSGNNYMEGYTGEYNGSSAGQIGEQLTRDDFGIVSSSDSAFDTGAAGSSVLFIPHYNSGVWKTTLRIQGVGDSAGTALLTAFSIWKSTSKINTLKIFPETASNISAGSVFSLLGIK